MSHPIPPTPSPPSNPLQRRRRDLIPKNAPNTSSPPQKRLRAILPARPPLSHQALIVTHTLINALDNPSALSRINPALVLPPPPPILPTPEPTKARFPRRRHWQRAAAAPTRTSSREGAASGAADPSAGVNADSPYSPAMESSGHSDRAIPSAQHTEELLSSSPANSSVGEHKQLRDEEEKRKEPMRDVNDGTERTNAKSSKKRKKERDAGFNEETGETRELRSSKRTRSRHDKNRTL
ncbi:hypothetical protein K458DRAFT_430962 [Lentithecium fluviatile CBS 122367]|uniref:Uncharacterized protein n=1 Tax=Lentithecium fluviatile CBS 122367 TaxID=1168545 RepID=A0A6G1J4K8_9PLEO|nr:hypothetical protein K458DRAFT_430962 [Lentithecium fluviatile CBS 122367]